MEYDLDNATDGSYGPGNSNLSSSAAEQHYYAIGATPHVLDFSEADLSFEGDDSNIGENDVSTADTEDSIVISDDAFNQDDSTLDSNSNLHSDSVTSFLQHSYIGHTFQDDSQSSYSDLPVGEDAEWRDDESVPITWKVKEFLTKAGQKLEHIQSPTGIFFPGRKAAVEWMREQGNWSTEDIELMQSKLKIRWTEDDPTIPAGWKTRTSQIKTKAGLTDMQWFLSPTGKMFRGRKSVLKHIQANPDNFDPEDIRNFKSVPTQNKKFSAEYDWNDNDPTVPLGWKSAIISMNSFGKIVESVRFLSPDGRFCTSRVEAIKYLLKDGAANNEDLDRLKLGLIQDGWETDPKLPPGWFMKPDRCRGKRKEAHYNYLSADFQYHRSTKAAIAHMKASGFTQEAVDKLIKKTHDEGKKLRPDKYDWLDGDESVPDGWKIRIVHCSNGLEREFFLAPDGGSFSGRKQALDHMNKGGFSYEDIRKMESGCKIRWVDDDPTLPFGWKTRTSEINSKNGKIPMQWFLNPDGKMLRGRKAALEEIQNSGHYTKEDIRKFKFVIPEIKRENYDWNENDPSVPMGWLTTMITMNSFGKMVKSKRFLAPCGRFCSSRDDAIKYMLKEGLYDDEEVEAMQAGFGEDTEYDEMNTGGWEMEDDGTSPVTITQDKKTPAKYFGDWASKQVSKEAEKRKWESGMEMDDSSKKPKLEVVDGFTVVKPEPDSGDDEPIPPEQFQIQTVQEDHNDDKDFVPKVRITKVKTENVADEDCFHLRSWRTGKKISRAPAVAVKAEVVPKEEGWVDDDITVPKGWKTKEYINKGGQKVKNMMSPDGTFCAGRKSAIDYMETSNGAYSQEDIELMQAGLKSIVWTDDDSTVPEGWKSRTTEIRTKSGMTNMQWFLSPEGKMFRGRKSALKFIESVDYYSKDAVRLFKSKPTTDKKFTKEYDWNENDPTVPLGWKSTVINMNSFGKIVESRRFLAPDGRYCSNRLDALRYMVKEGIFSLEDVNVMKGGLMADGWRMDPKLPEGWYMKPRKDKINEATASYHYISDTFQQFESTKSAIKFMKECHQYSAEDINKLESKIVSEAKKLCPDKYEWLDGDDTVPPGWKYRVVMCSNGLERHFFLAPDGSSYSGRKQAVEYMTKKNYSQDDIKIMESGFKIQWLDDDPSLPAGWKMRTTDMKTKNGTVPMQWFLSPEGKMFRGRKSTLDHITKSGLYDKEDIRKFRCSGDTPTKSQYDWDETDPSVPKGWKTTMITVNSFGKSVLSKRFLSPDGRFCSSRVDALKYMKKEDIFLKVDIDAMKLGLLSEGWEVDPLLPEDWFVKPDKHKEEEATFNYLAPDFSFLRSTRAAQNYLKNSSLYTQEDVDKLNALVDVGRKRIRLEKYGYNKADSTVPQGWKLKLSQCSTGAQQKVQILAPDGSSFLCRRSALQHMVREGFSDEEIEEMRNCLKHEGWEEDNLLPRGWRVRKSENTSNGVLDVDYTCMSRDGEVFNSLKGAIEFMENSRASNIKIENGVAHDNTPYTDDDIRKIRTLYDNESKQNRQQKYDWAENDPTVPPGWKTRTVEGKMKKKFFLAPDGSSFSCRRSGLQHMIKENFSEKEIGNMREMLVHEGWESDDFLPTNWKIRKSEGTTNGIYDVDYWYLSVEGLLFRSTKAVVEFMTESNSYNQQDIEQITQKLEVERKMVRQQKYDWIEGDPTVPPTWKVRVIEGKTRKTFFLSEDGNQFACRRSAYQHMIKEEYPESQILEMRECLVHEGWEDDDLLPNGWKVRKSEGSTNGMFDVNYYYISIDGTMFHSTRAVINYMKKRPEYNETDIKKIKTRLENETRKNRPQKYDWQEEENLPPGWKYRTIIKGGIRTDFILTAEGAQHQSRRAAIDSMIKENFDPHAIFKMWSTLHFEGWVTDDRLPRGWRVRSKDRLKDNWQFYFLSPQMEIFKSNKAVLDYITSQSDTYSQEDYEKVKIWIEEEQGARRGENYTWNEDPSLPAGWKMRTVVTNSNNIREFFMTPDGDHIAGRKKAIEVMRDQGIYEKKDIDKMVKEMKRVTERNQKKPPVQNPDVDGWGPGSVPNNAGEWQGDDSVSQEDDSMSQGYLPHSKQEWMGTPEEASTDPHSFFSSDDEDEMEDMRMFEDDDEVRNDPLNNVELVHNNIDMQGLVPEFEPVEITPVVQEVSHEEGFSDDDEDGFNDAEEITDDFLETEPSNNSSEPPVSVEDIKIEPDINNLLQHYM